MHRATDKFWHCYNSLPQEIRDRADKAFALLREKPRHPSLHFKKIGTFWSTRVDITHRALAVEDGQDFIWVWIGSHDQYERLIERS
ncbi:MAG: hypothetical protein NT056_08135 [Proteobacteria bacterium]|nr:hypothetical protein [Pseudomonadota bacterium]